MAIQGLNEAWMLQRAFHNPEAKTDWITRKYQDIAYGEAALQKLDIYLPENLAAVEKPARRAVCLPGKY